MVLIRVIRICMLRTYYSRKLCKKNKKSIFVIKNFIQLRRLLKKLIFK